MKFSMRAFALACSLSFMCVEAQQLKCGTGPYTTQKRIVGGTDAVKNSWPGIVRFDYVCTSSSLVNNLVDF